MLFRRADVIATGDILDLRHFPVIDAARGGSIQGELAALNRLLDLTVPAMPLVSSPDARCSCRGTAGSPITRELVEYRDMVDRHPATSSRTLIEKGMTLEQVKAANPTQGYRARAAPTPGRGPPTCSSRRSTTG